MIQLQKKMLSIGGVYLNFDPQFKIICNYCVVMVCWKIMNIEVQEVDSPARNRFLDLFSQTETFKIIIIMSPIESV